MDFLGYRRLDGSVGVRNHVLVLPTVACSTATAMRIAAEVEGAVTLWHDAGCAQTGADLEQTRRTLVGMGLNPNVHSVLVVSLGCESVSPKDVAAAIEESGKRVELLTIQEQGGSRRAAARGASTVEEMVEEANEQERVECSVSDLVVATQCGGSDAWSGVSANTGVGEAADLIVEAGGTVMLGETTEMIGAEHLLAARAADPDVASKIEAMVRETEQRMVEAGYDPRGSNPSPGNIEGGVTTLEEKSLGAVCKGGTTPVQEVLAYGERPTRRGLALMDTPGHDVVSISGMLAGGAQIVLFTTGRGTPVGSPIAPVIKIASNSATYKSMRENTDVDAGTILTGDETPTALGRRLLERLIRVAGGDSTKSERLEHGEFGIWRIGPTL